MSRIMLGSVLNPKSFTPAFFGRGPDYDNMVVNLYAGHNTAEVEGEGIFDGGYQSKHYSSEASGYPRIHTERGLLTRGAGYGSALYFALAAAAWMENKHHIPLAVTTSGPGVSSNRERSPDAERWWAATVARGIAFSGRYRFEEVDADGHRHVEIVEADVLPFEATGPAQGAFALVPWTGFSPYDGLWPMFDDPEGFVDRLFYVNADAFRLINLAGCDDVTVTAVKLVGEARPELKRVLAKVILTSEAAERLPGRAVVANPGLPSLTRRERVALQEHAALVAALGLDAFADLPG